MMDEIDREQLYNTAWRHWGSNTQLDICIEEMCEFVHAILAARRNGVTYSYAFYEEMADVLICLEQIETRLKKFPNEFDEQHRPTRMAWDKVIEIKEQKLERLKGRLFESLSKKFPDAGDSLGSGR